MELNFSSYQLNLKHPFGISSHIRSSTSIVLTKLSHQNFVGYGEASLPPYLEETVESAIIFLKKINMKQFNNPTAFLDILHYVDTLASNNNAAKASVDIALFDLIGKMVHLPLYKILKYKYTADNISPTSYTIGMDSLEKIKQKTIEANNYKILKIKLGGDNDKKIVETVREVTKRPLFIDANQGWSDKYYALDMINWLKERNTLLVEQPMPVENIEDTAWLTQCSPLPIIADESVKKSEDIKKIHQAFSGINIKLMKSAGIWEAAKMIKIAKGLGMKVMMGCMTETSCAISAATHLTSMVDYIDLDGNLLIDNDPFEGSKIIDGKIIINNKNGTGASIKDERLIFDK